MNRESQETPVRVGDDAVTRCGLVVADDALGLVGNTPLVRLGGLGAANAVIWAKAEFMNPAGSVKDRTALAMIVEAERAGLLRPGATVIEATSGNTGISLAMICAVRRYRCVLVMPQDMSMERRLVLKAYGAEVQLTGPEHGMMGAVQRANALRAEIAGAFTPSQFENTANPRVHEEMTAREILEQTGGRVSAFVAGVGTGGTVTGVGRALKRVLGPQVQVVGVEPAGSPVLSGGTPGNHGIPGLGAGFVPAILDNAVLDQIVRVHDVTAQKMAERLAREYGLLVGVSSGANVAAAADVSNRVGKGLVVTVLCDSGERYLF